MRLVLTAVLALVAGCAAGAQDPTPPGAGDDDGVELVNADDGSKAPGGTFASVRRTTSAPPAPGPIGQTTNDPWQSVLGPVPDPWQPPAASTAAPARPGSRP